MQMTESLADRAVAHACAYLAAVGELTVRATLSADELRERLGGSLPEERDDPIRVIDAIAEAGRMGTVASQGPRYFGFVTGGSIPAAIVADWLVSAWDQNAQMFVMSPIAAVVEQIVSEWLKELFGLPPAWSVGFVTGAQMASFTALIAARHHLLRQVDWDVERHGLFGAPPIDVVVSDQSHRTIFTALRMLGLGAERVRRVDSDSQGRMRPDVLARTLRGGHGPCIVCAQIGNVNTGAADPLEEIASLARERGAWLHVDGAFGLWAAATRSRRSLAAGIEHADSIATDGHKWLVPYDSGIVLTAHPDAHQHSLLMPAHYIQMTPGEREPRSFTPDESRRARGVPLYAALRVLGREGVGEIVDRCCHLATRMAAGLASHPYVQILNDVVLNQVLVQFRPPDRLDAEAAAALTQQVITRVQDDGTCWVGGTKWQGQVAMRISISNWSTTAEDIDRSAAAIISALASIVRDRAACD